MTRPARSWTCGGDPNLDLVVTADTAIGHLAGAFGTRFGWRSISPDWRWLLDREDSLVSHHAALPPNHLRPVARRLLRLAWAKAVDEDAPPAAQLTEIRGERAITNRSRATRKPELTVQNGLAARRSFPTGRRLTLTLATHEI